MRNLRTATALLLILGALSLCVWLAKYVPVGHWGFSISVTFLFIAVFTVIFDFLLKPKLTSAYFNSWPFERGGSLYRWFGVRYYASALRRIGWEKIRRQERPITRDMESIIQFERWTRGAEAVHALAAIAVAGITVWVGFIGSPSDTKWLVLSNVLFNVYPVMLQRYNRPRVEGIRRPRA
jgi:hypothetical protein